MMYQVRKNYIDNPTPSKKNRQDNKVGENITSNDDNKQEEKD